MEKLQNRYLLQEKLGSGGMATVWLALDPVLERQVAIKIINEQFRGQDDFLERFRREAAIAANLEHPYIGKVYEQGNHDGLPFIVMEYIKGPTLKEVIADLRTEEIKTISSQILEALSYAHSQGVLHRDIKAGNIIVSEDGVKLIDFGVAQIVHAPQITLPGQIIGTAEYMAPEIAEGQGASVLSDIYSFAVLLYEMLAKKLPYPGKTAIEVLHRQATSDPLAPSQINSDISPHLDAVVFCGLQKKPEKRYQSAEEFRKAILSKEKPPHSVSPLWPLAIALTLSLAAFFFIQEQRREMISFAGLNKSEAKRISEKLEINPLFLLRPGPGKAGEIFWQSKKAGQSIDSGDRVVFLIKSPGKKAVQTMPDLVGKKITEGKAILKNLDLDWQISFIAGDPGIILETNPGAGAVIKEESVILQVGRRALPDLIGQSLDQAISELSYLGIEYNIEYSESEEIADSVLSQDPAAGSFASEVFLTVASPSTFRQVPDLLGLTEAEALSQINTAGFSAITLYQTSDQPGLVEKQTPSPGLEKAIGQIVRIWIGREAKE